MLQEVLPVLSSLEGFTADPYVADDTFLLVGRAISYCPLYVYRDLAVVSVLLDTALHGTLTRSGLGIRGLVSPVLCPLSPSAPPLRPSSSSLWPA